MTEQWQTISTAGTYAKWENPGEVVEGVIASFTVDGGADFDGNPCPEMTLRTEDGMTIVSGSQASLRRAFTNGADKLRPGHRCRIEFTELYETNKGSKGKSFTVQVSPEPVMEDVSAEVPEGGEPFRVDAGEWHPGAWGSYPSRML